MPFDSVHLFATCFNKVIGCSKDSLLSVGQFDDTIPDYEFSCLESPHNFLSNNHLHIIYLMANDLCNKRAITRQMLYFVHSTIHFYEQIIHDADDVNVRPSSEMNTWFANPLRFDDIYEQIKNEWWSLQWVNHSTTLLEMGLSYKIYVFKKDRKEENFHSAIKIASEIANSFWKWFEDHKNDLPMIKTKMIVEDFLTRNCNDLLVKPEIPELNFENINQIDMAVIFPELF